MPIIQSVERALAILDLFDEHNGELKITDISNRMQLNKSTVHSLLKTLKKHNYIEQNPLNGHYRLGMKLLDRSSMLLNSLDIRQAARPILTEIARQTGQTAHLVVLDGKEGVYIDKVDGEKAVIRYSRIGRRVPLHCSSVGKVLSAFLPSPLFESIIRGYIFFRHTERSISNEADFRKELEQVRAKGYAVDDEENEIGVRCIGVPVRDYTGKVIAAISISMLVSRVSKREEEEYLELLNVKSAELSARMGYNTLTKST